MENWVSKKNTIFFKDGFQKLVQRWQKCIAVLVILWKHNCAALKIIDVGIFLFYCFIKISFPVHFLFKWRQHFQPALAHYTYIACLVMNVFVYDDCLRIL